MPQSIDIGARQTASDIDIGARQTASSGPQQVGSSGCTIPSMRHIGSPAVSGPIVVVGIPSKQHWPTPTVTGHQIVRPGALGPKRFWFTPSVSGPITVVGIPSKQHWPTPTVDLSQVVTVTAIPSKQSWPTPRVAHVQTIRVTGIPSKQHWPTPTVTGGPQWVNVIGIRGPRRIGVPGVMGGVLDFRIYLSGVDVTQYFSEVEGTHSIASQTLGRWQANFNLFDSTGTIKPSLNQSVLIVDRGRRQFAGCLTECKVDRLMSTDQEITFNCIALDKSSICDHRVIPGIVYPAVDPDSGNPNDVAETIIKICQSSLNGEGITPGPEIISGAFGDQSTDYNWNFPTVTQAFDTICNAEGLVWWIDENCVLHFSALDVLPAAPFAIGETTENWRNLTATKSTTSYYNKLYAVSNLNVLPGSGSSGGTSGGQSGVTETFTFTIGSPGVVSIIGPAGPIAVGIVVSAAIGSIISMTVNGFTQTTVNFANFAGQTRADGNDQLWFFATGNNQLSWTFGPPTGANIVVEYVPYVATSSSQAQYGTALVPQSPTGDPLPGCGSGIFEGVLQVQSIAFIDDLNATAAAELARVGIIPITLQFETDYPGLKPGQLLQVDIPKIGVGDGVHAVPMMITGASGDYIPGNSLPFGGNYRWRVEATTNLDPGNWWKWFERFVHRTDNPLPILQSEAWSFSLGVGSAVVAGNDQTAGAIVQRTGLLSQLSATAGIPPTGQDLVLQVTRSGVVLAELTMPGGSAPNGTIQVNIPKAQQVYVYAADVLNCNVSYQVTGGSPTAAANVSFTVRWTV